MFSIKAIEVLSGWAYEVTCFSEALANEVYEVALRKECSPNVDEDGDPCVVTIFYAEEKEIDAIVIEARNQFDEKTFGAVIEKEEEMLLAA